MSAVYRHRNEGCEQPIGVYWGVGLGTNESRLWLVRDLDGSMRRPAPGSRTNFWCPDCATNVYVHKLHGPVLERIT